MKTLFLLRHAKSSWDDPRLTDYERPLNKRGMRAAPFMGKLMREKSLIPDMIMSSPARRARQTVELVIAASGFDSDLVFDARIYEASPGTLLQVVSETAGRGSAMIVGHNPGLEGFVRYLTGEIEPMPTAALAVIDLSIKSWDEIKSDCGKVQRVYRPKDDIE